MIRAGLILCLVIVFVSAGSRADTGPVVRTEIEPGAISVGQAARLRVTVLVPTWFSTPPVYPAFEQVNAVTRLPPDSSFPTSERVGGESWSGIVRDYQIYPQSAISYEFSGLSMIVTYPDPQTQEPIKVEVPVPPFTLSGTVPEGAESLSPFLVSTSLKLDQKIEGETGSVGPGDAVVRTVTASIVDMPAMFLPPMLDEGDVAGVSIYLKAPVLQEKTTNRESRISSTRMESATYVFEQAGEFSLPAIELRWWNPDKRMIETASLPAVAISVKGSKMDTQSDQESFSTGDLFRLLELLVVFGGVVLILRRYGPVLWQKVRHRYEQWRSSESYAFKQLDNEIKRGKRQSIYRSMMNWFDRVQGDTFENPPSAILVSADSVGTLSRNIYGSGAATTGLTGSERLELRKKFAAFRRDQLNRRVDAAGSLPQLNP